MRVYNIGNKIMSPIVGIVGCLHGDELIGKQVIDQLVKRGGGGVRLKIIIANEKAIKLKKRYVETDLNRSFNGKKEGSFEERLAYDILSALQGCDYVIDIHSTYASMQDTIITTSKTFRRTRVKELINTIPLDKVLVIGPKIEKNSALIDSVRAGVSLEFNRNRTVEEIFAVISDILKNIRDQEGSKVKKQYFLAEKFMKAENGDKVRMENYIVVKKSSVFLFRNGVPIHAKSMFYPAFISEKAYVGNLCMICKPIRV